MMFYNLNQFNEHRLNYPAYSFAHILASTFDLTADQKERLLFIANEVWEDKMYLFNVAKYENILLGIMLYVLEEANEDPVDISTFTKELYKGDSSKDLIQIYNIYQIIEDLFAQRLDICQPSTLDCTSCC